VKDESFQIFQRYTGLVVFCVLWLSTTVFSLLFCPLACMSFILHVWHWWVFDSGVWELLGHKFFKWLSCFPECKQWIFNLIMWTAVLLLLLHFICFHKLWLDLWWMLLTLQKLVNICRTVLLRKDCWPFLLCWNLCWCRW
jgi:hypothetical protein